MASSSAADEGFVYPIIPRYGGVVRLSRAAEQPTKDAKVVVDVTAEGRPGEVNKGLQHVARLLNLYGVSGLTADDISVAAVLRGQPDGAVLSDEAYAARLNLARNPNLPLIRDLKKAGVEVFVCGQSLHEIGFGDDEVAEELVVAVSATVVLANKQADGHAYIPSR